MAIRQASVIKIKGRIGSDLVGYQMKGVSGVLVRTFDGQKISENVKTSANYANTRKNNSEFGAAASNAKGLYLSIPQRWRTVLSSFVLAKVQAQLLKMTRENDTTSAYGSRVLKFTPDMAAAMPNIVDQFSKKDFYEYAASAIGTSDSTISAESIQAGKYYQSGEYDGINFYTTDYYELRTATIGSDGVVSPSSTGVYSIVADKQKCLFSSVGPMAFDELSAPSTTGTAQAPSGNLRFMYICAVPFKTINNKEVEFINEACMMMVH